jgi:acyl dehydratase
MSQVRELAAIPSLGPLFAKAILPSLYRGPARIPSHTLSFRGLAQNLDRLADYDRVCGFTVRDSVSATWLHVLTFPLHVALLSDPDSSIRLAGVVHVSNQMRLHRQAGADEVLDISVQLTNLRPHSRGALFDVVGQVRVGAELVWEGLSTYLAPGVKVPGEAVPVERSAFEPGEPIAQWRLPADLGRQYRRVSGDPNPIHTHLLAAKAFGFTRPIIHGMWTHARLLAALDARLPASYAVEVSFTKPILLPATVGAWWRPAGEGWTAAVTTTNGAKPHLIAHITT